MEVANENYRRPWFGLSTCTDQAKSQDGVIHREVPGHQVVYLTFQKIRIREVTAKYPKQTGFNWHDTQASSAFMLTYKRKPEVT